jgi:hypothetical protein
VEVGIPERTFVNELADDEKRPPLPDEIESMRDRAVLVVRLGHESSVPS